VLSVSEAKMIPSNHAPRTNQLWDERPQDWRCPCCKRAKSALLRPGRDGGLLGALHWHHDHIMDYPNDLLRDNPQLGSNWMPRLETQFPGADHFRSGLCRFVERFPSEVICQDCNAAEGAAKQQIKADRYFSFAPPEITCIIASNPNEKHRVDREIAERIWRAQAGFLVRRKRFIERTIERLLVGDFWSAGYSFPHESYH
jgi:rubredoxin